MSGKFDGKEWVTVPELAEASGLPQRTIVYWINKGEIHADRMFNRGRYKIRVAEAERVMKEAGVK